MAFEKYSARGRLLAVLMLSWMSLFGAETVLLIDDDPGVGFRDNTPVAAVGGNAGTTLGEQRQLALQYAADIWGAYLESAVPIEILTGFTAYDCAAGPVLAKGVPTSVVRDFSGAPVANTWYPIGLANALAGRDLHTSVRPSDITLYFNSNIDGGSCLAGQSFYYGLDG